MAIRTARSAFAVALSTALVLGACQRDADAPAADTPATEAPAAAVAPGTTAAEDAGIDATRVVDHAPVAGAGRDFDVRAFAGTFAADGARLQLAADGTYALAVQGGGADQASTGTWTVEDGNARIRLDPDSKEEADRVFAIASEDELVAGDGGQVLRRDGA